MFDGQLERELIEGEPWFIQLLVQLRSHLYLLEAQDQRTVDIYDETRLQASEHSRLITMLIGKGSSL